METPANTEDEPVSLETLDQKLNLVLEKLALLLEPKVHFDAADYRRAKGLRDLPGGG